MSDALDLAQASRRDRGARLQEEHLDQLLDAIGLSESQVVEMFGTADVGPAARKKLKGIIDRLRTKPHPFTTCMSDLREHRPEWSEARRKKTCNVLKTLAGRNERKTSASVGGGACVLVDDDVATLLERVDTSALANLCAKED